MILVSVCANFEDYWCLRIDLHCIQSIFWTIFWRKYFFLIEFTKSVSVYESLSSMFRSSHTFTTFQGMNMKNVKKITSGSCQTLNWSRIQITCFVWAVVCLCGGRSVEGNECIILPAVTLMSSLKLFKMWNIRRHWHWLKFLSSSAFLFSKSMRRRVGTLLHISNTPYVLAHAHNKGLLLRYTLVALY